MRFLAVTPAGRVLAHGPDGPMGVRLDRTDLNRRSMGNTHGHGCLDRERADWPSYPLTRDLLYTLIDSPLLQIIGEARQEAADMVRRAIATIERTSWLDAEVRKAIECRVNRETVVERLQSKARTNVGHVYDLLIVDGVMNS